MVQKSNSLKGRQRHEERVAWLFITPVILGILIFQVYPTIFSLYASMTTWNLITPPRWVGFDNYVDLFTTDRFFLKSMWNTIRYTLGVVLPSMAISLFFASLLNQNIRFKHRLSGHLLRARLLRLRWRWRCCGGGSTNRTSVSSTRRWGRWASKDHPGSAPRTWALRSVIIMAIWAGIGFQIVIFLAGLQGISQEYYEAAAIDGANAWQKFTRITLPLLSPVTFFVLVTGVIGTFQDFSLVWVLTQGGPARRDPVNRDVFVRAGFPITEDGQGFCRRLCSLSGVVGLTILNFVISKTWVFYEESN